MLNIKTLGDKGKVVKMKMLKTEDSHWQSLYSAPGA